MIHIEDDAEEVESKEIYVGRIFGDEKRSV